MLHGCFTCYYITAYFLTGRQEHIIHVCCISGLLHYYFTGMQCYGNIIVIWPGCYSKRCAQCCCSNIMTVHRKWPGSIFCYFEKTFSTQVNMPVYGTEWFNVTQFTSSTQLHYR